MFKIALNFLRSLRELILESNVCLTFTGIVSEKQLAAGSPTIEKKLMRNRVIVEIDSAKVDS